MPFWKWFIFANPSWSTPILREHDRPVLIYIEKYLAKDHEHKTDNGSKYSPVHIPASIKAAVRINTAADENVFGFMGYVSTWIYDIIK